MVDEVKANHPNSLGASVIAIETKLGVDGDPITGLGGVSFSAAGVSANPSLTTIPTIWVNSVGHVLTYSYNSVDTILDAGHDLVTLAASATTGGLSLSTQEIGNQAAAAGTPVAAVDISLGDPTVANIAHFQVIDVNGVWYTASSNFGTKGQIYRHEGGTSWTAITNPSQIVNLPYSWLVLNGGEIWCGARNTSNDIYSYNPTTDAWTDRGSMAGTLTWLSCGCLHSGNVVVGDKTYEDGYVFENTTGTTWVSLGQPSGSPVDIVQVMSDGTDLYATQGSGVYKHVSGTTWTNLSFPVTSVQQLVNWNGTLIVSGVALSKPVVYKYTGGTSWSQLGSNVGSTNGYIKCLAIDNNNDIYTVPYSTTADEVVKYDMVLNTWTVAHSLSTNVGNYKYQGEFNSSNELAIPGGNKVAQFKDTYLDPVNGYLLSTDWTIFNDKAEADQTMYIGTTAVTIDRTTATLSLSDITFTAPIANQYNLSAMNTAPSSAADTGTLGEIRIVANAIYVCKATDTWVKADLATWV